MKTILLLTALTALAACSADPSNPNNAEDASTDEPVDVQEDTRTDDATSDAQDATPETDAPADTEDAPDDAQDMPASCVASTYQALTDFTSTSGKASPNTGTWNLDSNGSLSTTHSFDGHTRLTVRARTNQSVGWAMMRVEVAGDVLGIAHVSSTALGEYAFELPPGLQGDQPVRITYFNDILTEAYDRNLHVDSVTVDCEDISPPASAPNGASTDFCACASQDVRPDRFEQCAAMRPDGVGTYHQPGPYPLPPEAPESELAPRGEVTKGSLSNSSIHNGSSHDYWVYVPAQYDGTSPASLMVFFDGEKFQQPEWSYHATKVLDTLIHRGEMPVTIAVFVNPGTRPGEMPNDTRSREYDTPDDRNVRFVLEELLPAATGSLNISADPAHRGIGGSSSGGAAALTAAWERPDAFGLVYTTIGSFVRLRANDDGAYADRYATLIGEGRGPKGLRVVLLGGSQDIVTPEVNWPQAHMDLTTALDCRGWTYRSGYGDSIHSDASHSRTALPDNLRWLFERVPR